MEEVKKLDVTVNEEGIVTPYANEDPGNSGCSACCCVGCATCTNK